MKRELKNISFEWREHTELFVITKKYEVKEGTHFRKIILKRSDIFPLIRFLIRVLQKYFVTGLKTRKKKYENK